MRITVTTDDGEVIDQINIAEDIGDLTKALPQVELIDRLLDSAKLAYLKKVEKELSGN